jgi:hypothetical protein
MQNTDEALTEMRMKPPGDLMVHTGQRIDHSEGRAALGKRKALDTKNEITVTCTEVEFRPMFP